MISIARKPPSPARARPTTGRLAACLEDVLVKVSGALKLAGDPRLAPPNRAREIRHRAQLSRPDVGHADARRAGDADRPYDLTVDFDKTKSTISLGRSAVNRAFAPPVLGVSVTWTMAPENTSSRQMPGSRWRRAKRCAPQPAAGMSIVLPSEAALAKSAIDNAGQGGEVALVGRLVWDDKALGWVTEWRMQGRATASMEVRTALSTRLPPRHRRRRADIVR